jgi:magnesium transporter
MLSCFVATPTGLERRAQAGDAVPEGAVWLDLLEPTPAEERTVEQLLGVEVPTREEMREIEASSRLYQENGALYLTLTAVTRSESARPETSAITFILAGGRLATLRYADLLSFRTFVAYAEKHAGAGDSAPLVLAGLLEAIVERIADVLERIGGELDALSAGIFAPPDPARRAADSSRDLRALMQQIGRSGDLLSKARESLASQSRLLAFLQQTATTGLAEDQRARHHNLTRDVASLADHAAFINSKISLLLDATLGLINIEQNNIIKIFSVASVVFLPPTLIASIYGMNFRHMPELDWPVGYPLALGLMVASAILPYVYFRHRGWL